MKTEFEKIEAQSLTVGDEFKYLLSQRKVFKVSKVLRLEPEMDKNAPAGRKVVVFVENCKQLPFLVDEIVLKVKSTTTVPTVVKELEFDYSKVCEVYAKVRKFDDDVIIFQNVKGDYLTIAKNDKTMHFFHDNFPGPKRYFNHDMPISTFDQFEADLVRMKIPVPERNAAYQSPVTNNQ